MFCFKLLANCSTVLTKKNFKDAFYSIRLLKETFAPETPQTDRLADANWTPGCWSGIGSGSSQEDVHTDEIPQLSTTWDEAIPDERKTCIEKANKSM